MSESNEEIVVDGSELAPKSEKPKVEAEKADKSKEVDTAESLVQHLISMNEDDFIPWEEVCLPSKGIYYNDSIPGGVVRVRAMGIHADRILATQRLAQTGQSIDYLFKHCVDLPGDFDPTNLLTGDRIFLLYYLRGITHGNMYEFMVKCTNQDCGVSSKHVYDLNNLSRTIKYPDDNLGPEPFKVNLPYMSKAIGKEVWVKVRLLRGIDISAMAKRQKFNKRVNKSITPGGNQDRAVTIDSTVDDNIASVIVAIGGDGIQGEVKDSMKIRAVVDRMHAKDTATIREFLRNNSPGIDTTIEIECPECGNLMRMELPITESFFRPTSN